MLFNPRSAIGIQYLSYVENRARIWAEKYLDGRVPDYRGDETLQRLHFCNVWRELDRYSQWELNQIRGKPLSKQLDIIVIGRFNLIPSTTKILLKSPTRIMLEQHRHNCLANGESFYNPAIVIHSRTGEDYVDRFLSHYREYMADKPRLLAAVKSAGNGDELLKSLRGRYYGLGPFREYEVATSLSYSEHLPNIQEDDLFCVGPGAIGGLDLLTGTKRTDQKTFEILRDEIFHVLDRNRKFRWIPIDRQGSVHHRSPKKFTLRTLEDTLCEFRKYICAIDGISRYGAYKKSSRRIYRPKEPY